LTRREKYAARNLLTERLVDVTAAVAMAEQHALRGGENLRPDDLISAADAASIAGRSVRTIRRAYRAGKLLAYRDGNGHGVRIRYDDLRQWMTAALAVSRTPPGQDKLPTPPLKRLDMGGKVRAGQSSENLALLNAARAQRRRGGA
jgi:excisionase family DNA binding protein